jgi:protein-disulfide isomerase
MKNIPLLVVTIIGTLILVVAIAFISSGNSQTSQNEQLFDPTTLITDARHVYLESIDSSVIEGEATAEAQTATSSVQLNQELVTIVEFSDFQCPACKAAQPAVERVKAAFPGKVQIVYRHFPLDSIHPNARLAAIASEVVSSFDASKFWLFHDKLFEQQQVWSEITDRSELKERFADYAVELGLDRMQFLERMEDNSLAELVNLDVSLGTQLAVNATPTFYVNGVKTSAPQLITTVESLIK